MSSLAISIVRTIAWLTMVFALFARKVDAIFSGEGYTWLTTLMFWFIIPILILIFLKKRKTDSAQDEIKKRKGWSEKDYVVIGALIIFIILMIGYFSM